MSEEQSGFKVTDRRLFNPDGSPRDTQREAEQPTREESVAPEPVAQKSEASPVPASESSPERGPNSSAANRPEPQDDADPDDPSSFANFTMWVASNAASALGMMEHPATGERSVDIEIAKHWIDILGMLQRKTHGNLGPGENQILDSLLSDLRMQYVSLTGGVTGVPPRGYTASDILGGD